MPEWFEPVLLYVEAAKDLPQAYILDSVKRFLEVYEVAEQNVLTMYEIHSIRFWMWRSRRTYGFLA